LKASKAFREAVILRAGSTRAMVAASARVDSATPLRSAQNDSSSRAAHGRPAGSAHAIRRRPKARGEAVILRAVAGSTPAGVPALKAPKPSAQPSSCAQSQDPPLPRCPPGMRRRPRQSRHPARSRRIHPCRGAGLESAEPLGKAVILRAVAGSTPAEVPALKAPKPSAKPSSCAQSQDPPLPWRRPRQGWILRLRFAPRRMTAPAGPRTGGLPGPHTPSAGSRRPAAKPSSCAQSQDPPMPRCPP